MQPAATTIAPEGFQVTTSRDGDVVINRRRVGPPWFMWTFYLLFGGWLLGWLFAGPFLTYQALAVRKAPLWLAVLWWVCGIVIFRYGFGTAWWRLWSVTAYTFHGDKLLVENIFLTRRTRRKVDKRDVRIVRQVYDGGKVDDLVKHSWGLLLEGAGEFKLLAHEEFETSAWLGPLVAQWAGVNYESSHRHNDDDKA
ncbi:MAG: hypothetical protein HY299_18880 [Verrucomicrobia bacterium]|nr:hypothetical protein [Verrucomicrobiota bacterium]